MSINRHVNGKHDYAVRSCINHAILGHLISDKAMCPKPQERPRNWWIHRCWCPPLTQSVSLPEANHHRSHWITWKPNKYPHWLMIYGDFPHPNYPKVPGCPRHSKKHRPQGPCEWRHRDQISQPLQGNRWNLGDGFLAEGLNHQKHFYIGKGKETIVFPMKYGKHSRLSTGNHCFSYDIWGFPEPIQW